MMKAVILCLFAAHAYASIGSSNYVTLPSSKCGETWGVSVNNDGTVAYVLCTGGNMFNASFSVVAVDTQSMLVLDSIGLACTVCGYQPTLFSAGDTAVFYGADDTQGLGFIEVGYQNGALTELSRVTNSDTTDSYFMGAAYDPVGRKLYIPSGAGGSSSSGHYTYALWSLSLSPAPLALTELGAVTVPEGAQWASTAHSLMGNNLIATGGDGEDATFADVWTVDIHTLQATRLFHFDDTSSYSYAAVTSGTSGIVVTMNYTQIWGPHGYTCVVYTPVDFGSHARGSTTVCDRTTQFYTNGVFSGAGFAQMGDCVYISGIYGGNSSLTQVQSTGGGNIVLAGQTLIDDTLMPIASAPGYVYAVDTAQSLWKIAVSC